MADWDGSTVCNDGWRDSSEYYFQMQECKINRHYCTQDESGQINLKYGLAEKTQALTDIQAQISQLQIDANTAIIKAQSSGETTSFANAQIAQIERDTTIKVLQLNSFLYTTQSAFWNASNQADKECYALGDVEYYKLQVDYYKQLQTQTQPTQNAQQYTCSSNLILSGNKCVCDDGLAWYGNLCIPINDYCRAKFDINSYGNNQGCSCSDGYMWNTDRTTCVKVEAQAISQPLTPPVITQGPELTPVKSAEPPKIIVKPIPKEEQKNIEPEESIIIHATTSGQLISTSTQLDNSRQSFSLKENGAKSVSTFTQQTSQKSSIWKSMKRFFLKFKFW